MRSRYLISNINLPLNEDWRFRCFLETFYRELTKCSETTPKPQEVFKDNIIIS